MQKLPEGSYCFASQWLLSKVRHFQWASLLAEYWVNRSLRSCNWTCLRFAYFRIYFQSFKKIPFLVCNIQYSINSSLNEVISEMVSHKLATDEIEQWKDKVRYWNIYYIIKHSFLANDHVKRKQLSNVYHSGFSVVPYEQTWSPSDEHTRIDSISDYFWIQWAGLKCNIDFMILVWFQSLSLKIKTLSMECASAVNEDDNRRDKQFK